MTIEEEIERMFRFEWPQVFQELYCPTMPMFYPEDFE